MLDDFIFSKALLPLYYNYKKQNRYNYFKELQKRDKLSLEELKQLQFEKLKALIIHSYSHIPYYTKVFKTINLHPFDIKNIEDFSKIPELTKQDLIAHQPEMIWPKLRTEDMCYSATGGTTGEPIKVYKSIDDSEYGFALRYRSNAWCGWDISQKSVWFVSDLSRIKGTLEQSPWRKNLGTFIRRKLILDTRDCKAYAMKDWVEKIKKYKPKHAYGYCTLITEFARYVVENNIKISGIKSVYTTAEPLNERELISQAFNAPVYDQYGSSEVPCIAHECKNLNMHLNIDEIYTELIDIPNSNGLKRIVCTPLYLYSLPLLRYDLGDVVMPSDKVCSCGLPYPVIELKIGRISDNLLSPGGALVATSSIGLCIAEVTDNVKQFQIIQENINDYVFRLVLNDYNDYSVEEKLTSMLYLLVNSKNVNIKFEYPQEITPNKNGKFTPVISKVASDFNKIKV